MSRPYTEILARQQNVLWGDRYARTMGQALFDCGLHDTPTTFHAYIRKPPFGGSYLLSAGQNIIREWLAEQWQFTPDVLDAMREEVAIDPQTGTEKRIFSEEFLKMISTAPLQLTIDAMPEGSLAFPDEPIYRISGPAWQALWIETPITNSLNSQALFATLASRMATIADGQPFVEYGLRRAHSIGGLSESRASYVGGAHGTSNDQAWLHYKIPASGTMAHAFVMFFDNEMDSFRAYLNTMPHNAVLLIDTFDTIQGVKNAIRASRETGKKIKSVRLDSGDLAFLSKQVRKELDAAGFTDTKVIASNNLDEFKIDQMKSREHSAIDIWAVGTRLATTDIESSAGIIVPSQASLGAVYKLASIAKGMDVAGFNRLRADIRAGKVPLDPAVIVDKIKLSQDAVKSTIPGELGVIRYLNEDGLLDGSTLVPYLGRSPIDTASGRLIHDIFSIRKDDPTRSKTFKAGTRAYDPLRPMLSFGKLVGTSETIHDARARGIEEMKRLDPAHTRLINPHRFVVGLESGLYQHRQAMIDKIKVNLAP